MARRYRLRHPNSALARWARRVLGIAATGVVLAVGVLIATMVIPDDDEQVVVAPAPVSTTATKKSERHKLTERQRSGRRRAADRVRREGYTAVTLADYRADHVLRVLIGKPVGSTPKGLRAFFFVRGQYVGRDAGSPSLVLRPGRQLEREITLVYTLYDEGDRECCPKGGDTRVHFHWTGDALEPREQIPPDYQRMPAVFAQT
jgi:LppP/LprE lipoprotein